MKKIGIYLAFAPNQSISDHGIGRLLAFLMKAFQQLQLSTVIAIPKWYKHDLKQFLFENEIKIEHGEILTTSRVPYILRIWNFLNKYFNSKKKRFGYIQFCAKRIKTFIFKICAMWASSSSLLSFIFLSLSLFPLALFCLPFVVMGLLYFSFNFIICKIRKVYPDIFLFPPLRVFRNNIYFRSIYEELHKNEMKKLIRKINKRKDVSIWFVPTLIWPEINYIKKKKIVAAPDIVFIDFPIKFSNQISWIKSFEKIEKTLNIADHFICYSDYVKHNHLQKCLVNYEKITLIKHAAINLKPLLIEQGSENFKMRQEALNTICAYQNSLNNSYLRDFDFSHVRYIFYSSQLRPHKNYMMLVKAFEVLLRKRYINIKLIVTGDLREDAEIYNYIMSKRLYNDVIFMGNLSNKMLAALNHLAVCAVNPTLFEGGFPFTFTEAYSVGTPSVMSAIPVVEEVVVDLELRKAMLFDPYNLEDMVMKIEWALKHSTELYQIQKKLYTQLEERTWKTVAQEYINVFNAVLTHGNSETRKMNSNGFLAHSHVKTEVIKQ